MVKEVCNLPRKYHSYFSDSSFVPYSLSCSTVFLVLNFTLQICSVGCCLTHNLCTQQNGSELLYSLVLILVYKHFYFLNKISKWLHKRWTLDLLVLSLKPQATRDAAKYSILSTSSINLVSLFIFPSTLCSHTALFFNPSFPK